MHENYGKTVKYNLQLMINILIMMPEYYRLVNIQD